MYPYKGLMSIILFVIVKKKLSEFDGLRFIQTRIYLLLNCVKVDAKGIL